MLYFLLKGGYDMANLGENLEKVYGTDVMNVPVGLGGMILAGNMLGVIGFQIVEKIEDGMKLKGTNKILADAVGTAALAWVAANFIDDIAGKQTARLVSGLILANGADKLIGSTITSKEPVQKTTTELLRETIVKFGPTINEEEETAATETAATETAATETAATKSAATKSLGGYDSYFPEPAAEIGWLPDRTSFFPEKKAELVSVGSLMG